MLYGLVRRLPLHKLAFTVGDHTIGLAVGAGVWMALSGGRPASAATLPAALAGTLAYLVAKTLLFGGLVYLDENRPADVTPARLAGTVIAAMLMAVAVVLGAVLVAGNTALLFVALTLPNVGLYLMLRSEVRANAQRDEAEEAAQREAELGAQKHELLLQQQELTRRLQEADQMKDDLLAMVSHELRNPLTTVLGVFRLFTVGAPLSPAERQEMLEMGERQATRLRNLIEQLLLAARFDRGDASYPTSGAEAADADAAELALQARRGRVTATTPSGWSATAASPSGWRRTRSCRSSAACSTTPASTPRTSGWCGCWPNATGSTRCWPSRTRGGHPAGRAGARLRALHPARQGPHRAGPWAVHRPAARPRAGR